MNERGRSIRNPPVGPLYYVFAGGFFCLFVGLLAWKVTDYFTRPTVQITIDNALEQAVEVTIDGRPRGAVPPGGTQVFPCRHGPRSLEVTAAGEPVFSLSEDLPAPDQEGRPRQFLLNLRGAGRYRAYTADYGVSMRPNFPRIKVPIPGEDEAAWRRKEARELAAKIRLVKMPEWSDVSGYDVILERPPEVVKGAIAATRKVLARVAAADHAVLTSVPAKPAPTREDIEELRAVVRRLLAAEGPGG